MEKKSPACKDRNLSAFSKPSDMDLSYVHMESIHSSLCESSWQLVAISGKDSQDLPFASLYSSYT